MPWYIVEALKQGPLVTFLALALICFGKSYVVPGSQVTTVITQCTETKADLIKERDRWQRIALRGSNILQERAQDLAEVAPAANEAPRRVVVKSKPLAPEVKKRVEHPSTGTDAGSVEQRIETSNKVLQSAPVQTAPQSAKPKPSN